MKEPLDPFRQMYGEGALEQLDSLIPQFRNLKTEIDAEKLARSKFKFEPDVNRLPGSVSLEEMENILKEGESKGLDYLMGVTPKKKTEIIDIKKAADKRKTIDDLIDEYNANQDRLLLTDEEGGTLISYKEFNKIKDRNEEIAKALEEKGIKSTPEVEVKPEGEVIPFRKKPTEPEGKANGGRIGFKTGSGKKVLGYLKSTTLPELQAEYKRVLARYEGAMGVLNPNKMNFEDFKNEVQRLAKIGDDIKAEYRAKKAAMENVPAAEIVETAETPAKAGEGRFTKQQVLEKIIQSTIEANPTDEYVQKTFPNFIKEIREKPELANNENVWRTFTQDFPENKRLVVYSDDTVDFFTKGENLPEGMKQTEDLINTYGISMEEARRIKQMEPEDQVMEIKKLQINKERTQNAKGGSAGLNYLMGL